MGAQDDPPTPETIRALRAQRGWTEDELAHRLGMRGSGSIVSDWEEGRRTFEGPSADLLPSVIVARLESIERTGGRASEKSLSEQYVTSLCLVGGAGVEPRQEALLEGGVVNW